MTLNFFRAGNFFKFTPELSLLIVKISTSLQVLLAKSLKSLHVSVVSLLIHAVKAPKGNASKINKYLITVKKSNWEVVKPMKFSFISGGRMN